MHSTTWQKLCHRGLPQEVMSDNGTNFDGANTELKELISKLDESKIDANVWGTTSDLFPGKDNLLWVPKVQIGDQEYIRPISKLRPLECRDLERVDKPEFIKEGENDYKKINWKWNFT